jgi:hypothetical protein
VTLLHVISPVFFHLLSVFVAAALRRIVREAVRMAVLHAQFKVA